MKKLLLCSVSLFILNISFAQLIPYRKGDKWGFCDKSKKIIIQPVYDDAYTFKEGVAQVFKGYKYGFINSRSL
jgi:hypothetical protein